MQLLQQRMNIGVVMGALALATATLAAHGCSERVRAEHTASTARVNLPPTELARLAATPLASDAAIAALRALGPDGLTVALARYDALAADDPEKTRLAEAIDRVAAQRDAVVARLYWYTDLVAAKAAAHASGKPILSLRLLGRLEDELSCANSRFFRVALYANATVAGFLRDNFVLHWSSERPVPVVTIDYGDGRKLVRTVAGNSIHYVLDADGRPIDALPGLYGPKAFVAGLTAALAPARASASAALDDKTRAQLLRDYHTTQLAAVTAAWNAEVQVSGIRPGSPLIVLDNGTLFEAELRTQGKGYVERPMVRALQLGPQGARLADDAGAWNVMAARHLEEARLDERSRALFRAKRPSDWAAEPRPLAGDDLAAELDQFERAIAADTLRNEYTLHLQLHAWLLEPKAPADVDALNDRVYRTMFLTPRVDPWLGMATRGVFTGLTDDGIE